ncbi:MAG: sulfotransferase [Actinomycetota bacterium]|nr:sulfotransferase [Actinomycetota bacterium]
MSNPVLIVGVPRSGTTWVGRVLEHTDGVTFIGEPDSEHKEPFALRAKRGLGRFPLLAPGDSVPAYEALWDLALAGRSPSRSPIERAGRFLVRGAAVPAIHRAVDPRAPRSTGRLALVRRLAHRPSTPANGDHVVVKSVFVPLALDWLLSRRPDVATVVVERNPYNVVSSWLAMGFIPFPWHEDKRLDDLVLGPLGLPPLPSNPSPVEEIAWQVGVLSSVLRDVARKHPSIQLVTHEDLCRAPETLYKEVCHRAGLVWTETTQDYLANSNVPGTGYEPKRVAAEQPDKWRKRLTQHQVEEITKVLGEFPASSFEGPPI